jgi:outer membrane receptor protein involved in Fe transport
VHSGTAGVYWKQVIGAGSTLRVDGFVGRSLFDLFSDFTFFLNDRVDGDGIQQHDSRLQDGGSAQYLYSAKILGVPALLTAGANLADNRIAVDLFHQTGRHIIAAVPGDPSTEDYVHILNPAVYAQEAFEFLHLHLDAGLRLDTFRLAVTDQLNSANTGVITAAAAEPKLNLVYTPDAQLPLALHFNLGRAVTSQDARGMALDPHAPRAAATNFYMLGTSHQLLGFTASTDVFLIDRQHEDVYDPDNGTMQFQGPSRSYGWEVKASARVAPDLMWNGGLTQVGNAFYLGTVARQYVDSAPHSVGNASLTADGWRGLFASLRYRHIGHYLLVNPADTQVPAAPPYPNAARALASGLDVLDFATTKKLPHGLEASLAIDNVNDKRYYETQNLFDSRITPVGPAEARIHGTPGYPLGFTAGLSWRFE